MAPHLFLLKTEVKSGYDHHDHQSVRSQEVYSWRTQSVPPYLKGLELISDIWCVVYIVPTVLWIKDYSLNLLIIGHQHHPRGARRWRCKISAKYTEGNNGMSFDKIIISLQQWNILQTSESHHYEHILEKNFPQWNFVSELQWYFCVSSNSFLSAI